jgi:alkyldihydroxyacetonephosphate synthase
LLVLDEGDPAIIDATMQVVADACRPLATPAGDELVSEWLEHRNDTSALQALTHKGYVVDTMEIAARWSRLDAVYTATTEALLGAGATVASCHLSHSYLDGACLYFTFAAKPPADAIERTYIRLWDAGQRAVLAAGGNLSHHHGVGLNRARFMSEALGPAFDVLVALKAALDPCGILNPGKLGLPHPFGESVWP